MKRHLLRSLMCGGSVLALLLTATPASAVKLFSESDIVVGIDLSTSVFPVAEGPDKVVDQVFTEVPGPPIVYTTTKYLNFGKEQTGFIVTPASGASIVQSLQLRAANDVDARDPMTYELYGTDDSIVSPTNSFGDAEDWTLISSGNTGLAGLVGDAGRHQLGTIEEIVGNATAYKSYKVVFPTLRTTASANSMQVADVQLFTGAGGTGPVLATNDPVVGITHNMSTETAGNPGGETPAMALDEDENTKYLSFGRESSGLIVSRADGYDTIVQSLTFTTAANQGEQSRDPLTWALWGTHDPVTSASDSNGNAEDWILIDSGVTGFAGLNNQPSTEGGIQLVDNDTAYNAYRLVFPTLRNTGDLMQVGGILFDGQIVPEPSSFLMVGMAVTAFGVVARRRNSRSA